MGVRSSNLEVGIDTLLLGDGGYATDAAALAAWQAAAARSHASGDAFDPSVTIPPAGTFYWDTTNSQWRVSDGSSWASIPTGGAGAATWDQLYNTGGAVTADNGAIQFDKTDATAVFRVDLDGAVASPVFDINVDAVSTSPLFDIDCTAAYANDVFNVNLTNGAVGSQVLVVPNDGLAHTTEGWLIDADNAGAGSGDWISLVSAGIDTGVLLSLKRGTANATGAFVELESDANALGSVFLDLNVVGVQTANVIEIDFTTTGTANAIEVAAASTWTGSVLNWNNTNCVGAQFLEIPTTASVMTVDGWVLDVANSGATSGSWINLLSTGVDTGVLLDLNRTSAAATGAFIQCTSDATAVGSVFVDLDVVGVQTANVIEIDFSTTGSANAIEVAAASTWTGSVLNWNNTNCVGAQFLEVPTTASAMTVDGWVLDAANSGAGSGNWLSFLSTGIDTGNLVSLFRTTAAATGAFIQCESDASALGSVFIDLNVVGVQTANVIEIDFTTTGSANAIEVAAASTWTGSVLSFNSTNCVGANFLEVPTTASIMTESGWVLRALNSGNTTGDWIDLTSTGAGSGNLIDLNATTAAYTGDFIAVTTDANAVGCRVMDLDIVGVHTVPLFDIDFTAAATGGVLDINLDNTTGCQAILIDTNDAHTVALFQIIADTGSGVESCIDIDTTGIGANNVAVALDVIGTGDLEPGSDLVQLTYTGAASTTSNILAIEGTSASDGAGSYCLYVNGSGANMEGFHIDAGTCLIDETLAVTGGFTSAPIYAAATKTIATVANAGTWTLTTDGVVTVQSTGAGESRNVAAPAYMGQRVTFVHETDAGDTDLVFSSAVYNDQSAVDTTYDMDTLGEMIFMEAVQVSGALRWACIGYAGGAAAVTKWS